MSADGPVFDTEWSRRTGGRPLTLGYHPSTDTAVAASRGSRGGGDHSNTSRALVPGTNPSRVSRRRVSCRRREEGVGYGSSRSREGVGYGSSRLASQLAMDEAQRAGLY